MPGYVYKVVINGERKYSQTIFDNQSHKEFSTVTFYASNPFDEAFTSNIGTIWGMNVNGESIKGNIFNTILPWNLIFMF